MKYTFTFLLFICISGLQAQKQNNFWYFGNECGIDFNSGAPVVFTNGKLLTTEGCTSVSDANGNLLFYTDGVTVYNSVHAVMVNGNGLNGGNSSSQSAFAVPLPGSATIYYLFTVPDIGGPNGLCYSVIDVSLQGGLGEVVTKNIQLRTNITEKLCGTYQSNGLDYWIAVHDFNTDAFCVFGLTSAGVNLTPVISQTGLVHTDQLGYLKFSPDGKRLAVAITQTDGLELFDFDKATGIVSNPITFPPAAYIRPYGIEFSPDNARLYVCESGTGGPSDIYQVDLLAGSPADVINSAQLVGSTSNNFHGPLMLGPDCKIYVGRYSTEYMGVINNPNLAGTACNFVDTAIYLGGKICQFGLPNHISTCFGAVGFDGKCLGDSTVFSAALSAALLGMQWDFGDPGSGVNNVSFVANPSHYYSLAGTYTVTVIQYFTTYTDTITVTVTIHPLPNIDLGPDTSFCSGGTYQIHAGPGHATYLWQDNSSDSVFSAIAAGTYWVNVTDNGCMASDSIVLSTISCSFPAVNFISSDTVFCDKNCIDFTDLSTNIPTSWLWLFPGADSTSSTAQHPVNVCYNSYGSFDVTLIACNAAGCDTLHIPGFITEYQIPPKPVITQSNDTLYCTGAFSYAWYNVNNATVIISTDSFNVTSGGGSYFVIIDDVNGCRNTSDIFVATAINDLPAGAAYSIFPNPAKDRLNIYFTHVVNNHGVIVKISDLAGKIIYSEKMTGAELSVDIGSIADGLYFIHLETHEYIYNEKFLIQH